MGKYLIAVLAAIAIGSVGMWINLIGNAVPFMTVNFLRVFIAAVFLGILGLFFRRYLFKISKNEARYYIIIGFLIGAAMSLFNTAFHYLTITQTYVMDAFFPFFILVFGGYVLKDGIRASDLIALIFGAVAIIVLNPITFKTQIGVTIMFLEVVLYSIMVVYMRREGMVQTLKGTFWIFLFASLFLAPFPMIYGFGDAASVWHWLGLLGVGATGFGYICFNYSIMRLKTESMSITLLLGATIFAFLYAVFMFGETLSARFVAGTVILLVGGTFLHYMRGYGRGRLSKIIYYAGSKRSHYLFKRK